MVHSIAGELAGLGHAVRVHRCLGPAQPLKGGAAASDGEWPKRGEAIRNRLWFARTMARNRKLRVGDRKAIREFGPDVVLAA